MTCFSAEEILAIFSLYMGYYVGSWLHYYFKAENTISLFSAMNLKVICFGAHREHASTKLVTHEIFDLRSVER